MHYVNGVIPLDKVFSFCRLYLTIQKQAIIVGDILSAIKRLNGGLSMASGENLPKSKKQVALTVNGKKIELEINSRMTLAEFLREELDLTGTEVGCNRGECGSCTVILDGNAVLSCNVLAIEATGREALTIEGLAHILV
jgi:hypothetical protein